MSEYYLEMYAPRVYRLKDGEGNLIKDSLSMEESQKLLDSYNNPTPKKQTKKSKKKKEVEEKKNDKREEDRSLDD
jgi:hypothetical protein